MKQQPERVLIYDNEAVFQAIKGDIKTYMPKLKALQEAYNALEIGDFTDEVFTEIKDNGVSNIISDFETNLNKQLDDAKITNSNLRKVALEGTETAKANLTQAFEALQAVTIDIPAYGAVQRTKSLDLNDIAFINDAFLIADAEQIKEQYCRVYLEDETDNYIYNVLVNLKNSLNNFSVMAKKFGFGFELSDSGLSTFLTKDDDGTIRIKPTSIEHAKTLIPRMQAAQKARDEKEKRREEAKQREEAEQQAKMDAFRADPANSHLYKEHTQD